MNLFDNIVKNHSDLKTIKAIYNFDENIEVTVDQKSNKIKICAFNNENNKYIKLSTNKFKPLLNKFESFSSNIYFKDNYLHITLNKVSKNRAPKIVGYCRVSTRGQADANGLEVQKEEILKKYPTAGIFLESYTGTKVDRPIFNNILDELYSGDTLVVTKLDRLARNTVEGIKIVEELFSKNISVHVLNIGLLENTSMGKFFLTTLLAVAEMERNTIIERTQAGKEIAKTKEGFKEGRPKKFTSKQLDHALSMLSINGGSYSYSEVEEITNISKSTLTRECRKRKNIKSN